MTGVLSVVIPLYRLDECRLRNLSFIYDRLTEEIDQDHLDLIFSIQVSEKDVHKLRGFRRARKQYVLISDDKFHKSKLLNYGASCSIGSFILFLDSDIHFNFENLYNSIDNEDQIVKPFEYFIKLDEKETEQLINTRKISVQHSQVIEELGAGAIVVRKDIFQTVKYNEQFVNWGWEDIEYARRLKQFKLKVINQKSVHLYHKPVDINMDDYYKNRLLVGNIKEIDK